MLKTVPALAIVIKNALDRPYAAMQSGDLLHGRSSASQARRLWGILLRTLIRTIEVS
jgi:hypothetical protein